MVKLLLWVLVWQNPMWIGARIVQDNMPWYHTLTRPLFSPPDWLFGMVWAVLYLLLALASFAITRHGIDATNHKATWLIIAQLFLNALWTPLFFGMHHLMGSMLLVVAMLGMLMWLMKAAWPISKRAVWLLMPYAAWLCFAFYLNTAMWMMN